MILNDSHKELRRLLIQAQVPAVTVIELVKLKTPREYLPLEAEKEVDKLLKQIKRFYDSNKSSLNSSNKIRTARSRTLLTGERATDIKLQATLTIILTTLNTTGVLSLKIRRPAPPTASSFSQFSRARKIPSFIGHFSFSAGGRETV